MNTINIEGIEFYTCHIPTRKSNILIIGSKKGFLACGYLSIDVANKNDDVCAIVTGVENITGLLSSKVSSVSVAAEKLGIKEGMLGKDVLILMT